MVQVTHLFSRFLWLESCNQCTSCKQGTAQSTGCLTQLIEGSGDEMDLDLIINGAVMAPQANRCYLPVEHSLLTPSIIRNFSQEFIRHYDQGIHRPDHKFAIRWSRRSCEQRQRSYER